MFAGIQIRFTVMEKNSQNPPSFLEIKLERLKKKLAETQKELSETKDQLHKQENMQKLYGDIHEINEFSPTITSFFES